MPVGYRVTVYRRNIATMFTPNGEAGRWIYRVSSEMISAARAEAPVRSGHLKEAHRIYRDQVREGFFGNQYVTAYRIVNDAEHAEWVHEGTPSGNPGSKITAVMRVPKKPGLLRGAQLPKAAVFYTDGKFGRPTGVQGQHANPWLDRACTRVSAR